MIIGYFDYFVFGLIICLNIIFWGRDIPDRKGCLAGVVLFGVILPLASIFVEVRRVEATIGIIDTFEVLYTYLRVPLYWAIGFLQGLFGAGKFAVRDSKTRSSS